MSRSTEGLCPFKNEDEDMWSPVDNLAADRNLERLLWGNYQSYTSIIMGNKVPGLEEEGVKCACGPGNRFLPQRSG